MKSCRYWNMPDILSISYFLNISFARVIRQILLLEQIGQVWKRKINASNVTYKFIHFIEYHKCGYGNCPICKSAITNSEHWNHVRSHPAHENDAPPPRRNITFDNRANRGRQQHPHWLKRFRPDEKDVQNVGGGAKATGKAKFPSKQRSKK